MLLACVQTILVSNMLLAEAYGSGGCFWDNGHLYQADQLSPRRASTASTGWTRRAAWHLTQSRARATTATAGTRTRIRAGPGAMSAARPELPRNGFARTCAAQRPIPRACQPSQQKLKRRLKCQEERRCRCLPLPMPCPPGARWQLCSQ